MANVKIRIEGLDKLQAAMKQMPGVVKNELADGIDTSLSLLERTARQKAPKGATGHLAGSHEQKLNRFSLVGELFPTVDYAVYVHEGTRPHWPPYGEGTSLARWAKQRGIPPYLVARSISRKGTKAQPWLEETAKADRGTVERIMQKAVDEAIRKVFR